MEVFVLCLLKKETYYFSGSLSFSNKHAGDNFPNGNIKNLIYVFGRIFTFILFYFSNTHNRTKCVKLSFRQLFSIQTHDYCLKWDVVKRNAFIFHDFMQRQKGQSK